jgi:hypothetical protein
MKKLVLTLALVGTSASAYDLQLAQPKRVYMEAYEYQDMYDPYLAPLDKEMKYGGTFGTDFYLIHHKSAGVGLYWDNQLHFDQSERTGHVKHAGWKYEIGLSLLEAKGKPKLELFKQHWSRHVMEETRQEHFPVYDRWGFRINLYP